MLTMKAKSLKDRAGVGAKGNILTQCIHPSAHVRSKYPLVYDTKDFKKNHRTEFTLLDCERKKVRRRMLDCFFFFFFFQIKCVPRYRIIRQEESLQY